ncbi:uncharacterized protein G2W53_014551 [Senna tora]|uniref:Uncharacterized protein n=1 Tax=Senna tora TaxID=362788 RepID=A0A834WTR2_9FABA|nr:uncharacterized protein G2W53_014551 [Senna tora]
MVQDLEPEGTNLSAEERDNLERSNKKVKQNDSSADNHDVQMDEIGGVTPTGSAAHVARTHGNNDQLDSNMEEARNEEIDPNKKEEDGSKEEEGKESAAQSNFMSDNRKIVIREEAFGP